MKHVVESNNYSFMQHHERKTRHWLFLQEGLGQTKNSKGTYMYNTHKKKAQINLGRFKLES